MKKIIIITIVVLVVLVAGFYILNSYIYNEKQADDVPNDILTFEDCVAAGYPVLEIFPEQCVTPDGQRFTRDISDSNNNEVIDNAEAITIQGNFVCLPHIDTSGPQTLECAFGLQADNGDYYALRDSNPSFGRLNSIGTDSRVEIRGVFIPENSDKYQSIGIIEVEEVDMLDPGSQLQDTESQL